MEIENPLLTSTLPSRLSAGLQSLPRLEQMTISNPPLVSSFPTLKVLTCLKLLDIPDYCAEWRWIADLQGLQEMEVSFACMEMYQLKRGRDLLQTERLHAQGSKVRVERMSTRTLTIMENLPEYMFSKVY